MDFGDILNKWEQTNASRNKSGETRNPEVFMKDADSKYENRIRGEYRRRIRQGKPDDILDIHGLSGGEAHLSLNQFFINAKTNGFDKLRIIHGKGNHSQGDAVLDRVVRSFIEQCPYAGESGYEKASHGGSGATWVLLK
ncbi:MAG: Smr/MutS family protein [Treponema sp.]|jgi:DNA-nicking Smr family endonuclease|nr:Smr/MutS family protein [Treponema sp.]